MRTQSSSLEAVHAVSRRRFLKAAIVAAPALAWNPLRGMAAVSTKDVDGHLKFLDSRFDLCRRYQWTGLPPRKDRLRAANKFSRITVHHAGTSANTHERKADVASDIENIMTGHRNRRFGDIGYHFIVDRAGRVWEGRSLHYVGAHVSAENDENIGVMLLGNFEDQRPSSKQVQTLNDLSQALRFRFTVAQSRIFGHRDLGQTLCPGRYLYGYVGEIRQG